MYRELSPWERAVFERLLADQFPGRELVAPQLTSPKVQEIDEDGSLEFQLAEGFDMGRGRVNPVEAYAPDIDGMMIHFILHTIDDTVVEFEVYKDDSSRVVRRPDPTALAIMSPPYGP
jgi:hypothetical protein